MLKIQIRLLMLSHLEKAMAALIDADFQCYNKTYMERHRKSITNIKEQINVLTIDIITDKNIYDL